MAPGGRRHAGEPLPCLFCSSHRYTYSSSSSTLTRHHALLTSTHAWKSQKRRPSAVAMSP